MFKAKKQKRKKDRICSKQKKKTIEQVQFKANKQKKKIEYVRTLIIEQISWVVAAGPIPIFNVLKSNSARYFTKPINCIHVPIIQAGPFKSKLLHFQVQKICNYM